MENIVLIDFIASKDWSFLEALKRTTKEEWKLCGLQCNKYHGSAVKNIIRCFMYAVVAASIFFTRKRYRKILAWQQFYGIFLAAFYKFFHVKPCANVTVMAFIYKPKDGLLGKLYYAFVKCALQSGAIQRVIVFSKSEVQYYTELFDVPENLFCSVKLGIEDEKGFKKLETGSRYFLSAGRSNRDYVFLLGAWENVDFDLRIVCDELERKSSGHITVLNNCYGKDYFQELANCYAVVIPLKDENISSGQLVFLQAMMMGKPIIVTDNFTVREYITNEENGFIVAKNPAALIDAVDQLTKLDVYQRMSLSARERYVNVHTLYQMGVNVGSIIKE